MLLDTNHVPTGYTRTENVLKVHNFLMKMTMHMAI